MSHLLEAFKAKALKLDLEDPLKDYRDRFSLPKEPGAIYLCNNSLGLPALTTFTKMEKLFQEWSEFGAEGWFNPESNWYHSFDAAMRGPLAQLLGAKVDEVIVMNSLTVNLHLLFVSFFRPNKVRFKILIEAPSFPSDLYAVKSHLHFHGLDPNKALIIVKPRAGEHLLRQEDLDKVISEEGESIAIVFLSSVNFITGQLLDMQAIAKIAKSKGCYIGFDLAHSAGNVPMHLNEWGVDFAVGCSYKYLCSGPGGPGIAFVHESHHHEILPRFSGWWGNDPNTRFQMHLLDEFISYGGAYSWQVSTPSIVSMIPLVASLELFDEVGMLNFRRKSELQTAFLLEMLDALATSKFDMITPRNPVDRGCQISLLVHENPKACLHTLQKNNIICDFRSPNVIRVTPSPLYNTFEELYDFVGTFAIAITEEQLF